MFNVKTLKFISVLSFCTSSIFTIVLFVSGLNGMLACLLGVLMAICLELCKVGFFYESLTNETLNTTVRVLLGVISILLILSSIIASAGYIQNQSNITKNKTIKHSKEYEQLEESKNLQRQLLEGKRAEIEDIKANYSKQIQEMEQVKNNYPSNYYTRKEQLQEQINQKQTELTNILSNANKEVTSITKELQEPINISNLQVKETKGYTALFQTLATKVNKYNEYAEPTTGQELELYFYLMLSVIFEFVAVLTAYLSTHKKNLESLTYSNVEQPQEKKIIDMTRGKKETIKADTRNKIGFTQSQEPTTGIKQEHIQKYVDYMYNTANNDTSKGYNAIGKAIGITTEQARAIKGYLEQSNILRVEGNRTKIIKPKNECMGL